MKKKDLKKIISTTGAVVVGVVLPSTEVKASNMFNHDVLGTGSQLRYELLNNNNIVTNGFEKSSEMKCGEGKCGGKKKHAKKGKSAEAKCGEGKCGEGKCGGKKEHAKKDKSAEAKSGDEKNHAKEGESSKATKSIEEKDKSTEAKCGEGKCGGKMKEKK